MEPDIIKTDRENELEDRLQDLEYSVKDKETRIKELEYQLKEAKDYLNGMLLNVQAVARDLLDEAQKGTEFNPGSQQVYAIMLAGLDYCARYVLRSHYRLSDEIRTRLVQTMEHECDKIDQQRVKLEGVHWDGVEF